ncbi:folate family ECF transporter S component [uncultured Gemmiger sp.]|uniref:folate family ECF transporter S component n=1 Tax=uncultured Gemmiger sp. TaxID=1623490 RepID=UPI0025F3C3FA|nr:folate family ECF transporter S component [uncultured Gemmiger sp.]
MTRPLVPDAARLTRAAAELHNPRTLALAAVLSAINLALNQFSIPVSAYLEISFDFLASAAAGYLCGPWVAALSGVATDLLGYLLRPNGPYFPGFTLSALLLGIVYGLWYYRRPVRLWRIICCKLTVTVLFNFFLTPLWLHIMYGQAFVVLSSIRIVKNAVKFPVDVVLLMLVLRACEQYQKARRI